LTERLALTSIPPNASNAKNGATSLWVSSVIWTELARGLFHARGQVDGVADGGVFHAQV
jgi:hypothetical protein